MHSIGEWLPPSKIGGEWGIGNGEWGMAGSLFLVGEWGMENEIYYIGNGEWYMINQQGMGIGYV